MNKTRPIRILLTAGATHEPIDEVRFLGNHSSGKLGSHIALAAASFGYEVTLLYGQKSISTTSHPRLTSIPFSSTRDLAAKIDEHWPSHEILIMAAAVSDYTPRGGQIKGKLKREGNLTIELTPTDDLVQNIANNSRDDQYIIAFALEESSTLEDSAKKKLHRKGVAAIVANPIETMDADSIEAIVLRKDGTKLSPKTSQSKAKFALWLVEHLDSILHPTSND